MIVNGNIVLVTADDLFQLIKASNIFSEDMQIMNISSSKGERNIIIETSYVKETHPTMAVSLAPIRNKCADTNLLLNVQMSARLRVILSNNKIETIEDLAKKTKGDFGNISGVGEVLLMEAENILRNRNRNFREEKSSRLYRAYTTLIKNAKLLFWRAG